MLCFNVFLLLLVIVIITKLGVSETIVSKNDYQMRVNIKCIYVGPSGTYSRLRFTKNIKIYLNCFDSLERKFMFVSSVCINYSVLYHI